MSARGSFDRAEALRRLATTRFDVLVVGGGVTGAGTALDAVSRGLRTALIERDDFASGTSSKSSKLVHGGLRYLKQGDVGLVYQALAERQRLRHNAPHLVRVLPFLIPIFTGRNGLLARRLARGLDGVLWLYDLTGGARIGKMHRRVSKTEALAYMPSLDESRLAGGFVYYDAHADDARLTLALARTAALDHGAVVANGAGLVGLVKDSHGVIRGATVDAGHQVFEVRAATVVNAAGVWADDVRALDQPRHPASIRPAKGVHLTVPWERVRNNIAAVVPTADGRSVFVVPWPAPGEAPGEVPRFTYIGTTDTDHDGPLEDPRCSSEDIAYLLDAVNFSMTTRITEADVVGTWAGLRPLVDHAATGRSADLSRRHRVARSPGGLVTITGGKLTTYRAMAADAVDAAVDRLSELARLDGPMARAGNRAATARASRTKDLRLRGAVGYEEMLGDARDPLARHLVQRYGSEARTVRAMVARTPALAAPLVPGLPYVRAEAVYAARYEMARTLDDVLSRRTRARMLARDATDSAADDVASLLAPELGWDRAEQARQVHDYRGRLAQERSAAAPSEVVPAGSLGAGTDGGPGRGGPDGRPGDSLGAGEPARQPM